jgi:hypothetical protein
LALLVYGFMVFNATFNNISVISWQSVLLVEDLEKTIDLSQVTDKLNHIMLYTLPWSRFKLTISVVICTDCTGSCKSKYHTITAMTAPQEQVDQVHCNYFWQYDLWWSHYYVSPSNEGRTIVLVRFFLPLPLLLSEACPDHNFLSFQIGQLYLVCGCMTIRRCVTYRNDLRGTLTFDLKVKELFFK